MNRKINTTGLMLAGCLLAGNAFATVLYSDRASFSAVSGTSLTDDFEDTRYQDGDLMDAGTFHVHSDQHLSSIFGETTYVSPTAGGYSQVIVANGNSFYCNGCMDATILMFDSSSLVNGTSGVFGVGFDIVMYGAADTNTVRVSYADNSTESISIDLVNNFFGITSELTIRTLEFSASQPGSNGYFAMDNLTLASANTNLGNGNSAPAAIPEPTTLLLLGIGLAGLGYHRRHS